MQLNFERRPEQAVLPLLQLCKMIWIIDSVSKVQQPTSKRHPRQTAQSLFKTCKSTTKSGNIVCVCLNHCLGRTIRRDGLLIFVSGSITHTSTTVNHIPGGRDRIPLDNSRWLPGQSLAPGHLPIDPTPRCQIPELYHNPCFGLSGESHQR
jgi:hypothetical protein